MRAALGGDEARPRAASRRGARGRRAAGSRASASAASATGCSPSRRPRATIRRIPYSAFVENSMRLNPSDAVGFPLGRARRLGQRARAARWISRHGWISRAPLAAPRSARPSSVPCTPSRGSSIDQLELPGAGPARRRIVGGDAAEQLERVLVLGEHGRDEALDPVLAGPLDEPLEQRGAALRGPASRSTTATATSASSGRDAHVAGDADRFALRRRSRGPPRGRGGRPRSGT